MKPLVITVHGIWHPTLNWPPVFKEEIELEEENSWVYNFEYGFIPGIFAWLIGVTRQLKLHNYFKKRYSKKLFEFVDSARIHHPKHEIVLVGHSFGGWIIQAMLEDHPYLKVRNVIFVQCPISEHLNNSPLPSFIETGQVQRIYNWSSSKDSVIKYTGLVPPFGRAGYSGFYTTKLPFEGSLQGDKRITDFYDGKIRDIHFTKYDHDDILGDSFYEVKDEFLKQIRS